MRRRLRRLAIGAAFAGAAGAAGALAGSADVTVGICAIVALGLLVWAAAMVLAVLPPPKDDVKVRGAGVSYRPRIDASEEWIGRRVDYSRAERAALMALPSLVVVVVFPLLRILF